MIILVLASTARRSIMPVSIASSEKTVCPPGVVRRAAHQPSSTSGVTHNVRLPRRRRPASYSAQFFTRNFILGMWRRRGALCLFGMEGAAFQESVPEPPIFNPIRATTPGKRVRLGCLGGGALEADSGGAQELPAQHLAHDGNNNARVCVPEPTGRSTQGDRCYDAYSCSGAPLPFRQAGEDRRADQANRSSKGDSCSASY